MRREREGEVGKGGERGGEGGEGLVVDEEVDEKGGSGWERRRGTGGVDICIYINGQEVRG